MTALKQFGFHAELWLPRPCAEVFAFFSDAHNLETTTPTWLNFEALTSAPISMRVGALIDYRIHWRTEITGWNPPHQFVDVQRRGIYSLWHHTHTFEEREAGRFARTPCVTARVAAR